jgi:hypothetical protein
VRPSGTCVRNASSPQQAPAQDAWLAGLASDVGSSGTK